MTSKDLSSDASKHQPIRAAAPTSRSRSCTAPATFHRRARAAGEPELDDAVARYLEIVIASISLNHLGTAEPPPLVHLALTGFLALAETVFDSARARGLPRTEVMRFLADTLVATIQAATAIDGDRPSGQLP